MAHTRAVGDAVMRKIVALVAACLLLSACVSSEERIKELAQAMADGGYATSFEKMDQRFLDELIWVGLGVSDGCMSIIEVTDRQKLKFASETGMLAGHAEVSVAKDSDGNTGVNGRFILVTGRQNGEYCATLYGEYLEDRDFSEFRERQDKAVRYFRTIK